MEVNTIAVYSYINEQCDVGYGLDILHDIYGVADWIS
jgi:hypothetical protein